MITGSVTINGVSDEQLRMALGVKINNEDVLTFNPQQLQQTPKQAGQPTQLYNNMILGWRDHKGLKAVEEILVDLTK